MVKKIGIITINDYSNYGNRLQNYASQVLFQSMGYDVTTLVIKRDLSSKKNLKKLFSISFVDMIYRLNGIVNSRIYKTKIINREQMIKDFSKKYIIESKKVYFGEKFDKKINDYYDYFFVGSDQVWNPNYMGKGGLFFLKGIDSKKKNSISASFGINTLDKNLISSYRDNLKTFNSISVREIRAKDIISEIDSSISSTVLLDPTMLIDNNIWINMFKRQTIINTPYILLYSLGPINKHLMKKVRKLAKEKKYQIINLMRIKNDYYESDPIDFVELIYNAKLVITDSFHGTVFSILMNVPFLTTDRVTINSLSSRIDTLLSTFELQERRLSNIEEIDIFDIDWDKKDKILKEKKKESEEFFKNIFIKQEREC